MGIVKYASGQQPRGKPVVLCSESVPVSYLLSACGIMPLTLTLLLDQATVLVGAAVVFIRRVQSSQMMLCTGQRGACCPWSCPGLGPAPQLHHKPRVAS